MREFPSLGLAGSLLIAHPDLLDPNFRRTVLIISASDPQESESYTFDFVKDLAAGETIVSAAWECAVAADSKLPDADAATRLVGVPANRWAERGSF